MAEAANRQEKRDVAPKPLVLFGVGLAVFIAVAVAAIRLVLGPPIEWPAPGPAGRDNRASPALQVAPAGELQALRAAAEAELRALGWADREAGIAVIPISDAMALVAERGLPGWRANLADDGAECRLLTRAVPRAPQAARCWAQEIAP